MAAVPYISACAVSSHGVQLVSAAELPDPVTPIFDMSDAAPHDPPPSAHPATGSRRTLTKRGSFYDPENDTYTLSSGAHDREPLRALNGALRDKTAANIKLAAALKEAQTRVTALEHEQREAARRAKLTRADRAANHAKAIASVQSAAQRDVKAAKERAQKLFKKTQQLQHANEILTSEVARLSQDLEAMATSHKSVTADASSLQHQVHILTQKLTQTNQTLEDKSAREQQLDQAVLRLGSRIEALVKEHKRVLDQDRQEDEDRTRRMRDRGEQLTALATQLEQRTTELGAVEYEKAQCEATITVLRAEVHSLRDLHGVTASVEEKAMGTVNAAVAVVKNQLKESEDARAQLREQVIDLERQLRAQDGKILGLENQLGEKQKSADESHRVVASVKGRLERVEEELAATTKKLEGERKAVAALDQQWRHAQSQLDDHKSLRDRLDTALAAKEELHVEAAKQAQHCQDLDAQMAALRADLVAAQEKLREKEVYLTSQLAVEQSGERVLHGAIEQSVAERARHDRRHVAAAERICRRMYTVRAQLNQARAVVRWLSSHNRALREDVTRTRELVRAEEATDTLQTIVSPSVEPPPQFTTVTHDKDEDFPCAAHTQERTRPSVTPPESLTPIERSPAPSMPSPGGTLKASMLALLSPSGPTALPGSTPAPHPIAARPGVDVRWAQVPMPVGDAEGFLQAFIHRANALRDEAARSVTPELIVQAQALVANVAERIAIEVYDCGEYLYDISFDMQPTLEEARRLRRANANPSKMAEIKNEAAAQASVAHSRVRAALHLAREGMVSWLLTIFGNAVQLLAEIETPGAVEEQETDDGDVAGKRTVAAAHALLAASSEELIRICSEQWTKRRWPHTDPNATLLEEVRADVKVAAEEEYWRRYTETIRGQRVTMDQIRADVTDVEEPTANVNFWGYLDPLPGDASLVHIERHIWSLVALVNHQQITETLGEVRLRRYDVHRKLLDTALYAAVLRFVGHGREGTEPHVTPHVGARIVSPEKKWLNRREEARRQTARPSRDKSPPFVSASRRNTLSEPLQESGGVSTRLKSFMNHGAPVLGKGRPRHSRVPGPRGKSKTSSRLKLTIKAPIAHDYRGRGGKSPSSGSAALRSLLKGRSDEAVAKMRFQTEATLEEV